MNKFKKRRERHHRHVPFHKLPEKKATNRHAQVKQSSAAGKSTASIKLEEKQPMSVPPPSATNKLSDEQADSFIHTPSSSLSWSKLLTPNVGYKQESEVDSSIMAKAPFLPPPRELVKQQQQTSQRLGGTMQSHAVAATAAAKRVPYMQKLWDKMDDNLKECSRKVSQPVRVC